MAFGDTRFSYLLLPLLPLLHCHLQFALKKICKLPLLTSIAALGSTS